MPDKPLRLNQRTFKRKATIKNTDAEKLTIHSKMIHNQDCSSITQTYFKRTARLEVKEKIQVTLSQCTQTGIQQDAGPIRGGGGQAGHLARVST